MRGIGRPRQRLALAAFAVAVLLIVVGSVVALQPGPPVARERGLYGSGIGADALANTQVGGTSCGCPNLASSFRFRATRTAPLAAVRVYLITSREGYAAGTGGTIQATVEDDVEPDHHPSGRPLATTSVPLEPFPRAVFETPANLVAGRRYHLVFRNLDPAPTMNFVSVNSLYAEEPEVPRQPAFDDTDWAQLLDTGTGWTVRPEYTPILELEYGDGRADGVGYMESWIAAAKVISGPTRVRERFVVSGGNVEVSEMAVRLGRLTGSGSLTIRLETGDGRPLAESEAPASAIPAVAPETEAGGGWISVHLPEPLLLVDGRTYDLVLSTDPATRYRIHGLRKGVAVGFSPQTWFADGIAEVETSDGWVAFDPGWRGPLSEADLQFLLR